MSSTATAANVSGSAAVTPKSMLDSKRISGSAAAMPKATPSSPSFTPRPRTEPHNITALRAKRHAHTNLVRALADDVRNHAVHADARQQEPASAANTSRRIMDERRKASEPSRSSCMVVSPNITC